MIKSYQILVMMPNNATLFGSLFAALGGLFLVGKRRKKKK